MIWISTAIFGVLVLVGGLAGYARARSLMSLLAGTASGVVLVYAAFAIARSRPEGIPIAISVSLLLALLFLFRWRKTGAFMPAGLLLLLSLAELAVLLIPR